MKALSADSSFLARWGRLSLLHRTVLITLVLGVALVLWTMLGAGGFFVSPLYMRSLAAPAAVAALLIAAAWIKLMPVLLVQPGHYGDRMHGFGALTKYFILPLLMGGMFVFFPLMNGLPSLLHKLVGAPFSETFTVSGKTAAQSRRRSCNRVQIGELEDHWFGRLCVADEAFNELTPSAPIVVTGTRSWFGVEIVEYGYYSKKQ